MDYKETGAFYKKLNKFFESEGLKIDTATFGKPNPGDRPQSLKIIYRKLAKKPPKKEPEKA